MPMIVRAAALVPARWRNGLGTSREIAGRVDAAGALLWQVSIADLEQDAPFSHYPGCDRIFTPIAGDPPPELAFHGGPFAPCPLLAPKPFPGDVPTLSRIPAPGRAFNVIVDRTRFRATVTVQHLPPGAAPAQAPSDAVLLHCLTGELTCGSERLSPGDSIIDPPPAMAPGAAIAIVVTITQLA